jgi:hypothetical protein
MSHLPTATTTIHTFKPWWNTFLPMPQMQGSVKRSWHLRSAIQKTSLRPLSSGFLIQRTDWSRTDQTYRARPFQFA